MSGGLLSPINDIAGAVFGFDYDIPEATFDPMDIQSGLGAATFGPEGAQFELAPELQQFYNQLLGGAGETLQQAQQFDPYQAAEGLFGRMESILAPTRERERAALESRLLSQGRLGSTGGLFDLQAQQGAVEAQRAQSLNQAFGQAQQVQQGLFGRGLAGLQAATGLQQQGLSQLGLGLEAGQGALGAQQFNIGNELQQAQLFPSLMSGLFTGAMGGWAAGGFKNLMGGAAAAV